MEIKLGNTVLCAGQQRSVNGSPVGPSNFRSVESPGVIRHEYIGADRISPEHIRCNSGTISFDVERIFATVDAALQYILVDSRNETVEGELKFGEETVFDKASVTTRSVTHVGCAVVVSYTIEG